MALVAHWKMNDAAGQKVVVDSAGSNNGEAAINIVSVSGKTGRAISFNGTTDKITVAASSDFDFTAAGQGKAFTIACWAKPSNVNTAERLVYRYDGDGTEDGYYLAQTTGKWTFAVHLTAGDSDTADSSDAPTGGWQHLAGTRDASGVMTLYVDGVAVDTGSKDGDLDGDDEPLYIGVDRVAGGEFTGSLDDVRVYNTELSVSEIRTIMATGEYRTFRDRVRR